MSDRVAVKKLSRQWHKRHNIILPSGNNLLRALREPHPVCLTHPPTRETLPPGLTRMGTLCVRRLRFSLSTGSIEGRVEYFLRGKLEIKGFSRAPRPPFLWPQPCRYRSATSARRIVMRASAPQRCSCARWATRRRCTNGASRKPSTRPSACAPRAPSQGRSRLLTIGPTENNTCILFVLLLPVGIKSLAEIKSGRNNRHILSHGVNDEKSRRWSKRK